MNRRRAEWQFASGPQSARGWRLGHGYHCVVLVPLLLSLAVLIWILFYPARWLVRLASRTTPGVVFFVRTERPWVSLTFDDGPDEEVTPAVLQILSRSSRAFGHADWSSCRYARFSAKAGKASRHCYAGV